MRSRKKKGLSVCLCRYEQWTQTPPNWPTTIEKWGNERRNWMENNWNWLSQFHDFVLLSLDGVFVIFISINIGLTEQPFGGRCGACSCRFFFPFCRNKSNTSKNKSIEVENGNRQLASTTAATPASAAVHKTATVISLIYSADQAFVIKMIPIDSAFVRGRSLVCGCRCCWCCCCCCRCLVCCPFYF